MLRYYLIAFLTISFSCSTQIQSKEVFATIPQGSNGCTPMPMDKAMHHQKKSSSKVQNKTRFKRSRIKRACIYIGCALGCVIVIGAAVFATMCVVGVIAIADAFMKLVLL